MVTETESEPVQSPASMLSPLDWRDVGYGFGSAGYSLLHSLNLLWEEYRQLPQWVYRCIIEGYFAGQEDLQRYREDMKSGADRVGEEEIPF